MVSGGRRWAAGVQRTQGRLPAARFQATFVKDTLVLGLHGGFPSAIRPLQPLGGQLACPKMGDHSTGGIGVPLHSVARGLGPFPGVLRSLQPHALFPVFNRQSVGLARGPGKGLGSPELDRERKQLLASLLQSVTSEGGWPRGGWQHCDWCVCFGNRYLRTPGFFSQDQYCPLWGLPINGGPQRGRVLGEAGGCPSPGLHGEEMGPGFCRLTSL